jgi:hypothetical protein
MRTMRALFPLSGTRWMRSPCCSRAGRRLNLMDELTQGLTTLAHGFARKERLP